MAPPRITAGLILALLIASVPLARANTLSITCHNVNGHAVQYLGPSSSNAVHPPIALYVDGFGIPDDLLTFDRGGELGSHLIAVVRVGDSEYRFDTTPCAGGNSSTELAIVRRSDDLEGPLQTTYACGCR